MSNMVNVEKLKSIIGEYAFQQLVKKCPGKNVYIPKNFDDNYHSRNRRNQNIRNDYHGGMEVPELMEKYSLSKASIYKIIEKR